MEETKQQINKTEESDGNPIYIKTFGIRALYKRSIKRKGTKFHKDPLIKVTNWFSYIKTTPFLSFYDSNYTTTFKV